MNRLKDFTFSALSIFFLMSIEVYAIEVDLLASLRSEITAAAKLEIENSGVPSLQIAVGLEGEIVYENAFGMSDLENSVQASSDTKYRTASIAKWFTATAAMKLSENGLLDLDKPVRTYCKDFPEKKWPISSRQLLTHTAGIRGYIDYEELISSTKDKLEVARLRKKQLLDTVSLYTRYTDIIEPLTSFRDDPLIFKPGTDWAYTSFGYRLLACVMQGATGEDYRVVMNNLVFQPAMMTNTLADDAWSIIPHRAAGYRMQRGKPIRRADMRDVSENLPAGGYLSTASDLIKFAQWFNRDQLSDNNKRLMTSAVTVDQVDSENNHSWRDAIPNQARYGYGLMLWSKYKSGMIGHTGRQAGASSILILLPNEGVSIAVMTNAKGWNGYLNFVMKLYSVLQRLHPNRF